MEPNENLGFLIHNTAFVLGRQSDQILLERLGFGFAQFKVMMVLGAQNGVSQRLIAQKLGQTEASVSRQIKYMHEKGLVTSAVDSRNRRVHQASLTHKGERLLDKSLQLLNKYYAPLFESLNSKQQIELKNTLSQINVVLTENS